MAVRKDRTLYKIIPSLQEFADDAPEETPQVPANGKEWFIESVRGTAPNCSEGWVALVWDYDGPNEEYLYATYNSDKDFMPLNKVIVGDGTKKLCIVFHNESGADLLMGFVYKAREL